MLVLMGRRGRHPGARFLSTPIALVDKTRDCFAASPVTYFVQGYAFWITIKLLDGDDLLLENLQALHHEHRRFALGRRAQVGAAQPQRCVLRAGPMLPFATYAALCRCSSSP